MDIKTDLMEITEKDIPTHMSRYCETTEKLEVLLDPDKKIWVTEGVPVKDKNSSPKEIEIPNSPHVFMVRDLWVSDENNKNLLLTDVPIIFAHGYRVGDVWKFANGQPVAETVQAYNEKAKLNNTPTIEFILSCNRDNSNDPLGIKVKDVPDHIAQAVGETISLHIGHGSTEMSQEGAVVMTVSVEGKFWGLDELRDYKRVEVLPQKE